MANSLSKKISIFPISFDRSQGDTYTSYKRNGTPISNTLTETQKSFLEINLVISEETYNNNNSWASDYYTENKINPTPRESYANGRVLSEKNITRLISALTDDDHKNFVVHADIPTTGSDANKICNYIEFVIRGHYFVVDLFQNTEIGHNPGEAGYNRYTNGLWVGVKFRDTYIINDSANLDEYEQLFAYDNSEDDYDVLAEVDFFDTAPNQGNGWKSSSYNEHLQLLEKLPDGTIRVPTESQFKFTSRSIKNINGGTI